MARARAGDGPTLMEVMTYRYREHSEGLRINVDYRDEQEREEWLGRDPIKLFRDVLVERGVASAEEVDELEAAVAQEVEDAVAFTMESPDPEPEVAFSDLYTDHYEIEVLR